MKNLDNYIKTVFYDAYKENEKLFDVDYEFAYTVSGDTLDLYFYSKYSTVKNRVIKRLKNNLLANYKVKLNEVDKKSLNTILKNNLENGLKLETNIELKEFTVGRIKNQGKFLLYDVKSFKDDVSNINYTIYRCLDTSSKKLSLSMIEDKDICVFN